MSIKELQMSDAGYYGCEAGNAVGAELSKRVRLRVLVRAHFKSTFELQRVQRGHHLQLECRAFGEKPLHIRWLRERLELNGLDKRYELGEQDTENGAIGRLRLATATRRDSATFTCVASNAYGQAELAHRILVEEPPDPPAQIELSEFSHSSATLRFAAPYNGNSPTRAYVCEWKPQSVSNWTEAASTRFEGSVQQITINQLAPLSAYDLRLFAENSFGRSESSQVDTITTDEQGMQLLNNDFITCRPYFKTVFPCLSFFFFHLFIFYSFFT